MRRRRHGPPIPHEPFDGARAPPLPAQTDRTQRHESTHLQALFLFGLPSRKIIRGARKRGAEYSFLFVHPDGGQLSQIAEILKAGHIRPVIDNIFPFSEAKEALGYLAKGRAKGKVVVQMR